MWPFDYFRKKKLSNLETKNFPIYSSLFMCGCFRNIDDVDDSDEGIDPVVILVDIVED